MSSSLVSDYLAFPFFFLELVLLTRQQYRNLDVDRLINEQYKITEKCIHYLLFIKLDLKTIQLYNLLIYALLTENTFYKDIIMNTIKLDKRPAMPRSFKLNFDPLTAQHSSGRRHTTTHVNYKLSPLNRIDDRKLKLRQVNSLFYDLYLVISWSLSSKLFYYTLMKKHGSFLATLLPFKCHFTDEFAPHKVAYWQGRPDKVAHSSLLYWGD